MLAGLRARYGLSLRGAARVTGLSPAFWCQLEAGSRSPSTVTAALLLGAFELTAAEQVLLDAAAVPGVGRAYGLNVDARMTQTPPT
jgi:transcriptional regulator with XRE-family HTH domain